MADQNGKQSNGDRLVNMLDGMNPAKPGSITKELFADVIKEIKEEKGKEVKAKAKEHLLKSMDLTQKMEKLRREFEVQYKKMDKELGKMLGQINGMLAGKSLEEIEEEGKEKDSDAPAG